MNSTEKKMFDLVKSLRDDFGAIGLKAEFEAEGTRTEELLRLLEIGHRAGVKMALKIGGCEAVRDLIEAKQFGVNYIIAPMVESAYALSKFVDAKNKVFGSDELSDVQFLFNLETQLGYENLDEMIRVAALSNGCRGIVFGRVDFVGSRAMARDTVDSGVITEFVNSVGTACRQTGLDLVVGGGVSNSSIPALCEMRCNHLTRFETRKVIFGADSLENRNLGRGLLAAVHFELLWLLNKREFYSVITREDDMRIEMLESRWKVLSEKY